MKLGRGEVRTWFENGIPKEIDGARPGKFNPTDDLCRGIPELNK